MGGVAEGGDLVGGVHRAQLGALGDRDHAGLDMVGDTEQVGEPASCSGRSLPSTDGRSISLAPRMRSGAPVSSMATWAQSVQTTASAGPSRQARARMLAPVPLKVSSVVTSPNSSPNAPSHSASSRRRRRPRRGPRSPRRRPRAPLGGRRRSCRWRTSGRGAGQLHRLSIALLSAAHVRDGGRGAGPQRRTPAHGSRAARRRRRARAAAARRLRYRRRPRRRGERRRRHGGPPRGQARLRRLQRAAGVGPARPVARSSARRPSGSARSPAINRSPATARPSSPTCRRRSTPSTRPRSTPS